MFSNKQQNENVKPKSNFTALKSFLMNFYKTQNGNTDNINQSNSNIFSICSHNHFHSVHQKKTWDLAKTLRAKGETKNYRDENDSIENQPNFYHENRCNHKHQNLRIDSKNVVKANEELKEAKIKADSPFFENHRPFVPIKEDIIVSTDSIKNLSSLGNKVDRYGFDREQEEYKRINIRQIGFNIATLTQQKSSIENIQSKPKLEIKKKTKYKSKEKVKEISKAMEQDEELTYSKQSTDQKEYQQNTFESMKRSTSKAKLNSDLDDSGRSDFRNERKQVAPQKMIKMQVILKSRKCRK